MTESINHDGLARLIKLELTRLGLADAAEAQRIIQGRIGAYDLDGTAISKGMAAYYRDGRGVKASH